MKRNMSDAREYPNDKVEWVGEWSHGGKNYVSNLFLCDLINESKYIENQLVEVLDHMVIFQWFTGLTGITVTDTIVYTRINS